MGADFDTKQGLTADRGVPGAWGPATRWVVKPLHLLVIAIVLSALIFGSSFYEQARDREAILQVMRQQARSLAEIVSKGASNAIHANDEIVSERLGRLTGISEHIVRMWRARPQSDTEISKIARELQVDEITVYDKMGRRIGGSQSAGDRELSLSDRSPETLGDGPVRSHSSYRLDFEQGIVVVRDDPLEMLEMRKRVGVGRLIRDIGDEAGVAYVVLQDEEGIMAASNEVSHLAAVSADPFLRRVKDTGEEDARVTTFDGREILESVLPFELDEQSRGLLRVGLWMEPVREVEAWGRSRLLWMSAGLAVAVLILVNFLMLRQNYDTLSGAFRQIRTYTGDVLEHMADGVVVIDASGNIGTFNRAAERIFEYSAEEVLGKSCRVIVADQAPVLEQTLQTGVGLLDEACHYKTHRGKELVLSVSTSVLLGEGGAPDACIAVVKDLTEQKKIEREMQRRERLAAMGDLAAGVAHEVRNPMNAIGMTVQRLASEFVPRENEPEYRELVTLVESEIDRVNGIVEQFLTLARPPKLIRQVTRVDTLVHDLGQLIVAKTREASQELSVHPGEPCSLAVDREQLSQALLNLMMNAIDATPAGGRISLRTEARSDMEGEWVAFVVADTGEGMDDATQRRIFDPYYTTKATGTGLGLSTVERIVADHNGRLDVVSETGKGASFTILLPAEGSDESHNSDRG